MKRLALLLGLAAVLPAAEIVRRDVQFSLGAAPTDFDYSITSPGGSFAGSDSFDNDIAARLGGRWAISSPGWSLAPVVGIDLLYRRATYAAGGGMDGPGLAPTVGLAWAINDRWSADLELALSYERSDVDLGGGSGLAGSGTTIGTDVRLRGLRQLDRRWSLGLELGWQQASTSFAADRGRDVELELSGWTAGLIVVWRSSMRPAGLE